MQPEGTRFKVGDRVRWITVLGNPTGTVKKAPKKHEQPKAAKRLEDVVAQHANPTFTKEDFRDALVKVFPRPIGIKSGQRGKKPSG